jgi:hypothetical protein
MSPSILVVEKENREWKRRSSIKVESKVESKVEKSQRSKGSKETSPRDEGTTQRTTCHAQVAVQDRSRYGGQP